MSKFAPMDSLRPLTKPAYFIAALLVVLPMLDGLISVWPIRLSEETWRFGAMGALSSLLLLPLLGTWLALALATAFDQRSVRRGIGWWCMAMAVVSGIGLLVFLLDFLQTHAVVAPGLVSAVEAAGAATLVKQGAIIAAFTILSRTALRKTATPPPNAPTLRQPTAGTGTPLIPLSGASRRD